MFKSISAHKTKKPSGISEKVIRILDIYTLIAQKQYPSVSSLQERFDIGRRTVHRYLETIKMIDSIEFDREKEGYKFVHGDRIKKLLLSPEELALLVTFSDTVSHLGTPLRENFQQFLTKIVNVANCSSKKAASIVIKIPDAIENDKFDEYFRAIMTYVEEKRSVDIAYTTRATKDVKERRVDPYGLFTTAHGFLLVIAM